MNKWRPQTLVLTRDRNVLAWVQSRQSSDMCAFTGIGSFIVDRTMVRRGHSYGARLLAPDGTVAAQELAKFRQYEDCRLRMKWNTIRIEEGKNQ